MNVIKQADGRYRIDGQIFGTPEEALDFAAKRSAAPSQAAFPMSDTPRREEPPPKKFKWWLWVPFGAICAFFTLGAVVGNTPEGKEKTASRGAISYCWKEQKRQSNTPGQARLIAGACEQMEAEFLRKFHVSP